jgi:hypothetical protein
MAGEMNFDTHGQETLAAMTTAAVEDLASGFGFHAGAESVLLFTGPLRRLISAFHSCRNLLSRTICDSAAILSMSG